MFGQELPLETKSKKNIKISVIKKKNLKKLNKQIIIKCSRFERVGWKTVETEKLV